MTKRLFSASVLACLISWPALADTPCGDAPEDEWISVAQIATLAGQAGYDVHGVERERGCYRVRARSESGETVTLLMHPVSGEIVEEQG